MAQTVASYPVAALTSPVNGDALSAAVVLSNDNTVRAAYVSHDADPGIHLQSSTLANRPAFGTAGRKWLTADSGVYRLFFDTGSAWEELTTVGTLSALQVDNLNLNGNALTSTSGGITITPLAGETLTLDGTIVVDAGVVTGATSITSTTFVGDVTGNVTGNVTGDVSGTAATVTGAAQTAITSVGTLTGLTVSGTASPSIVTTGTGQSITIQTNASVGTVTLACGNGGTSRVIAAGSPSRVFSVQRLGAAVFMSFESQTGEEVYLGADNAATFYINNNANTSTPWLTLNATDLGLFGYAVSFGANDSGGAGYRTVRIANT